MKKDRIVLDLLQIEMIEGWSDKLGMSIQLEYKDSRNHNKKKKWVLYILEVKQTNLNNFNTSISSDSLSF